MKVICVRNKLKNSLTITERVLGKNTTLPILSNFLISAEDGNLIISATNLEIGINYKISCKIEKNGSVSVSGKLLTDLINNLPTEKVILEQKDESLIVSYENYKTILTGLNPSEFPIIPKLKDGYMIEMEASYLREGILQVINAAAITDTRLEINSIALKIQNNLLKIVSTDSFRLAEKKIFQKINKTEDDIFIIPLKTAQEIIKILENKNKIKIYLSKNQIFLESDGIEMFSRLIEGSFPDYEQILPKQYKTHITINKNELINAIRVASIFSSKINDIKFQINPSQEEIEIISTSTDKGENLIKLKAQISGEKQDIVFNYRYLSDGLVNINDEKVILELSGDSSPTLLKPTNSDDYFYLIMPIKNF